MEYQSSFPTENHHEKFLDLAKYAARKRILHVSLSCVVKAKSTKLKSHGDPCSVIVDELVRICKEDNYKNKQEKHKKVMLLCGFCESVLLDPITIACGHTFCRKCIYLCPHRPCIRCGDYCLNRRYHTNTIVNKCVELSYPLEKEKKKYKDDGNKCMNEGKFHQAVDLYSQGIKLDNCDHFLLGNRAKAFLSINNFNAALDDSNLASRVRPDWTKGFYRKATSLMELQRCSEAALNYFICLYLDPTINEARDGLLCCLRVLLRNKEKCFQRLESYATEYLNIFNNDRLEFLSKMGTTDISLWFESLWDAPTENTQSQRSLKRRASRISLQDTVQPSKIARVTDDSTVDYKTVISYTTEPEFEKIFNMDDFECCLCFRLLYRPVTTPCGHSFCRQCLDRCLDYNPECPLCKQSLVMFLEERRNSSSEILVQIMNRCWPDEVASRKVIYEEELANLARAGMDLQHELPIFVCALAFPFVPCQLHVFEPRYRLMIRRCMEVRDPKFGITVGTEGPQPFVDVGTILNIRNVQYLPDGRSFVDSIGGRRFRVRGRNMQDGYNTATVELISDAPLSAAKIQEIAPVCQQLYTRVFNWYRSLDQQLIEQFSANYGPFPDRDMHCLSSRDGPPWLWWLIAVMPQDISRRLELIGSTDFESRLTRMKSVFSRLVPSSG